MASSLNNTSIPVVVAVNAVNNPTRVAANNDQNVANETIDKSEFKTNP
ncbi:23025_t:CDS:2 [Entrophospora sp. SA101]|nr:23025_t:CDS:2 [Entrophospora sp. SA101]CAJ0899376.1 16087_t:CDS:2 [Entrophospora sp. SA101]